MSYGNEWTLSEEWGEPYHNVAAQMTVLPMLHTAHIASCSLHRIGRPAPHALQLSGRLMCRASL